MDGEADRGVPRTPEELRIDELERQRAPEWSDENPPTMADFLKAAARAVKYLKNLEP